jgi:hypothetical protein
MLPSTCGTNISGPSSPTTYCLSALTGPPLALAIPPVASTVPPLIPKNEGSLFFNFPSLINSLTAFLK